MKWLDEARKHIGQKEVKGSASNEWIVKLWSLKDKWLGSDDSLVAWCGAFMRFVFDSCGIPTPKTYYRAKDWLKWGQGLNRPCVGCVVVFDRVGGGHVGLVIGQDKKHNLLVLGGNQGDSVSIAAFPIGRVSGYRFPPNNPLPNDYTLPILDLNAKISTNEA